MKRHSIALIGTLAVAVVLFLGNPVFGGDYHRGNTLFCSDCHVMHASQSHGYNPDGSGWFVPLGGQQYEYLLRNSINELCLTCHNGSTFAPDVLESNIVSGVRQGGALNRNNVAPYFDSTGHTLGTVDPAPGGTWAPAAEHGLTCIDCHHPHGRGGPVVTNGYRNLNPTAGTAGYFDPPSYAVGTNDPTKDVFERSAGGYTIQDVDFNEPDQTKSAYANWCGACHSDFHGAVGSATIGGSGGSGFERHPTAGVNIGAVGGGHTSTAVFATGSRANVAGAKTNHVKVMTATGNWRPQQASEVTDHTPSCMSCHKAHGNRNPFGLIYMRNTGAVTEEGTAGGGYRDLCRQCHVQ